MTRGIHTGRPAPQDSGQQTSAQTFEPLQLPAFNNSGVGVFSRCGPDDDQTGEDGRRREGFGSSGEEGSREAVNVGATRGELRGIGGFPPTEAHRRHCNALPKAASSIVRTRPRHAATRTPCAARRNSPSPVCRNAPPRYNRTSHDVPPLERPTTARSASTLAPAPPWGQIRRHGPLRRGGRTGDAGRRSPLVHGYVLDPTATGRGGGRELEPAAMSRGAQV